MSELLGCVSGRINTHNFSFIAEAKVKKFQYIKIYHEEAGFILCQVIELTNDENKVTCDCEIIGYRDSRGLLRTPNSTIRHGIEVYNADSDFIKAVLGLDKQEGSILYLGILENYNMISVKLDAKKLVTKHLAVLAKTGAGKSYTLGVIVEELLETSIPCLIIDPHGEYSSLKFANSNKSELEIMHRYDVKPKSYRNSIQEYSPNTSLNTDSKPLSISISSLSAQEISTLTPIKLGGTQLGILYNTISEVKKTKQDYDLTDIKSHLDTINSNAKYGLYACLDFLENLGIFSDQPVSVEDLIKPGKCTLINLKGVAPDIQRIIAAKLCHDLFEKRKKNQVVPFFLIIEEAHNFCPERSFGESPSSYIIRNIASEGRKFGLGLGIVTQRPARVDKNVLSQCNTQIIQKVTNPNDLKAIASSAENISTSVVDDIATLPIGTALVIGAAVKPVLVDVRVRKSEHGGKSVSLDYKPAPEENNIKTVKINLLKLDAQKSITPAYLAVINNKGVNYSLLINDECKVMEYADNKLKPISQKRTEGLGAKSETILNIINEKGTTNISHLFNSLNYSFQDVDFILRELQNKRLILIQGSRLISNNNINFADYSINKIVETVEYEESKLPEHKSKESEVRRFFELKNLNINSIIKIYIK